MTIAAGNRARAVWPAKPVSLIGAMMPLSRRADKTAPEMKRKQTPVCTAIGINAGSA